MKVTINWTDHRYSTHDFKELYKLPEIGSQKTENDMRYTVAAIQELTSKAARSDFGDFGYYEFYCVYFDDEQLTEDEENGHSFTYYEPAGEHFEFIAIWHNYNEEE